MTEEPERAVQVMGVLNVTPDSFSDGGAHLGVDAALTRAIEMIDQGAAWIDVGGESTRPGAVPVDPDTELRRVLPVIEAVSPVARAAGVRISIDTRHETTARAAVDAGADLLNDVSASLWPVAVELGVGWVAMHMRGEPGTMQAAPSYVDVLDEVRAFLVRRAQQALDAGVAEVWVDPGIGFGKTTEHNMVLLAGLELLVAEGFPVMVGTSRKRFLADLLARSDHLGPEDPLPGPEERVDGSLATATWAMVKGARVLRVHDVAPTVGAAMIVAGGFPVS